MIHKNGCHGKLLLKLLEVQVGTQHNLNAADTPQTGTGDPDRCFRHSPTIHILGLKGGVTQIVTDEVTDIASQRLTGDVHWVDSDRGSGRDTENTNNVPTAPPEMSPEVKHQ